MKLRDAIEEITNWVAAIHVAVAWEHLDTQDAVTKVAQIRDAARAIIGEDLLETVL